MCARGEAPDPEEEGNGDNGNEAEWDTGSDPPVAPRGRAGSGWRTRIEGPSQVKLARRALGTPARPQAAERGDVSGG
jgi:hypothetical protein